MKILIIHSFYQQRGGEDVVVESEIGLLIENGYSVELYLCNNSDLKKFNSLRVFLTAIWNFKAFHDVDEIIKNKKPDVIHVHNTFPLISPSVYWAAYINNIPVVQTLHNFRLHCPQGTYLRSNRVCELCKGRVPIFSLIFKCYRNSYLASFGLFFVIVFHRVFRTFKKINTFIALSGFGKDKFVEGGMDGRIIKIKPNFIKFTESEFTGKQSGFGVYAGRLSYEKGIDVLCRMREILDCNILVVGDGEYREKVRSVFKNGYIGFKSFSDVYELIRRAAYVVIPSICFEGSPRSIIEAYSCGVPVIASRIGSLEDMVIDGVTGIFFQPGSEVDFARAVKWADENPDEMKRMGLAAKEYYLEKYSEKVNIKLLESIYKDVNFHQKR